MKISTKGRYSLEALLCLALLPGSSYTSTHSIAELTGLPEGYLEQLFIPLKKAGIISSGRGPLGGYHLGKTDGEISVGDILRVAEGPLEPVSCVTSQSCPAQSYCLSRHTWGELYSEITECVDNITLADLVRAYSVIDEPEYVI
ncbi:MAG: Rrf2 family transcriptional regulator [Spirochaetales bacterium]|jgi:Rrf2 family protein|nr:Rrf2 family transcriptional regulator [Spirochaetales bacterium]